MNIDEFRALKAQQDSQKESIEVEEPEVSEREVEEKLEETPVVEENETEQKETPKLEEIEIEGVGKIGIDELKDGYFRQSDYTKKTQKLAKERKENADAIALFKYLKENPNAAQAVSEKVKLPETVDPATAKVVELENKLYDMMLDNEIRELKGRYEDFDVGKVLKVAYDKQMTNLEDAYLLSKKTVEPPNMDELEKQLRAKILKEMEEEKKSTQTLISSGKSTPIKMTEKHISKQEQYVARNMKMTDEEFIFWRDKKSKGK